ncbi:olfactory receptor 13-like [Spea bombifrons]|uniref:olfactory receptor 13-like n=1 Tax=Spea bombifrons TaxID=233779 RepID=UPI002349BC6B|nr:olfactory receptor 13-like [Spea bombifrons]
MNGKSLCPDASYPAPFSESIGVDTPPMMVLEVWRFQSNALEIPATRAAQTIQAQGCSLALCCVVGLRCVVGPEGKDGGHVLRVPLLQRTQIVFFVLFFLMYIFTVFGNIILIGAVISSSRMHTPMYYFLCQLSILDLVYSSASVPKMLADMISTEGGRISLIGCMIQMSVSLLLGETECILLAIMAFDRYVAICLPLRYAVLMSWRLCKTLTGVMWSGCFLMTTFPLISKPPVFCKDNRVDHFACESLVILKMCGDTLFYDKMIFWGSVFTLLLPFMFIIATYVCIITSILKIRSMDGRTKAFSTCVSHVTVVLLFYGTSISMYLVPTRKFPESQKYISLNYGVVTPMLNPLIYSLRNNDVKSVVKNIFHAVFQ